MRGGSQLPGQLIEDLGEAIDLGRREDVGEWKPRMKLADTIVPWAAEWLLHYELWLATGEWGGGGVHRGEH